MINLLPPLTKQEIRAARVNVLLVRYVVLLTAATVFVLGALGTGFYITWNDKNAALAREQQANNSASTYAKVKQDSESFAKDLSTAKTILSGEVSYSQLLIDIANVLPAGTIVDNLSLASNSFGTPVTLTARTKLGPDAANRDINALNLKKALEASSLFENVSINSTTLTENPGTPLEVKYPLTVVLSTTLSKPKPGATP
jgi:Tfp pilus assembly protein PilN